MVADYTEEPREPISTYFNNLKDNNIGVSLSERRYPDFCSLNIVQSHSNLLKPVEDSLSGLNVKELDALLGGKRAIVQHRLVQPFWADSKNRYWKWWRLQCKTYAAYLVLTIYADFISQHQEKIAEILKGKKCDRFFAFISQGINRYTRGDKDEEIIAWASNKMLGEGILYPTSERIVELVKDALVGYDRPKKPFDLAEACYALKGHIERGDLCLNNCIYEQKQAEKQLQAALDEERNIPLEFIASVSTTHTTIATLLASVLQAYARSAGENKIKYNEMLVCFIKHGLLPFELLSLVSHDRRLNTKEIEKSLNKLEWDLLALCAAEIDPVSPITKKIFEIVKKYCESTQAQLTPNLWTRIVEKFYGLFNQKYIDRGEKESRRNEIIELLRMFYLSRDNLNGLDAQLLDRIIEYGQDIGRGDKLYKQLGGQLCQSNKLPWERLPMTLFDGNKNRELNRLGKLVKREKGEERSLLQEVRLYS